VTAIETRADVDAGPGSIVGPVSCPGATIEARRVDAAGGVIITVAGAIGRNDATALSTCLHAELDADPTVVVINLSQVYACDPAGLEVLTGVCERARAAEVGLHLVDLGAPAARRWMADAGFA
jgi:anti-anti-sigma regulatory factor